MRWIPGPLPRRSGQGSPTGPVRRLPLALTTDLPVLVMLVVCWLLVPVGWAHLASGIALAALALFHLWTRRRKVARLFRGSRSAGRRRWTRRIAYVLFLTSAFLMTASGLLRWAGVPPEHTAHAETSTLLTAGALIHLWSARRALRARLRRSTPDPPAPQAPPAPARTHVDSA